MNGTNTENFVGQPLDFGPRPPGRSDHLTDVALDATWNYTVFKDHLLTGYTTWIHGDQNLDESHFLFRANPKDTRPLSA